MFTELLFFLMTVQSLQVALAWSSTRSSINPETPIRYPGPVKNLSNKYGNEDYQPLPLPDPCKGKSFCTIKPPDYPQKKFNQLFKGHKQVPQVTWVPEDMFDNRQGDPSEADGCETMVSYEPLYLVRNKRDGEWRTVIQSPEENFVQKVRLEECKNTRSKCFTIAGDLGIETFCKQKYSVWEFLVSDGQNGTERIKTQLPVCCSCHYRV